MTYQEKLHQLEVDYKKAKSDLAKEYLSDAKYRKGQIVLYKKPNWTGVRELPSSVEFGIIGAVSVGPDDKPEYTIMQLVVRDSDYNSTEVPEKLDSGSIACTVKESSIITVLRMYDEHSIKYLNLLTSRLQ